MKTFELKTLGCKVNQYESQALRERLLGLGLKEAPAEGADICIVNTCSVTRKAEADSLDTVRTFNRNNPQAKIFVTGCSAQNNPEIIKRLNGVHAVLGNDQKESLPDILEAKGAATDASSNKPLVSAFHKHTRAFLKIQDGCNYGCSYCIIPKLRGASRSRQLARIVKEAKQLADNGYKEIVLCGICLGAYGRDLGCKDGLIKVMEELERIEGLPRLRLSSIEASDVRPALIRKMGDSPKVCQHLHIPFQSGDDEILKLMRRKTLTDGYRRLIRALRRQSPYIGITTDIMIGFPGEKETNFKNTLNFLKEVRPSRMHIFPFSGRKNTPAYHFKDTIQNGIIKERAKIMKALAKELAQDFYRQNMERELDVLVEANTAKGLANRPDGRGLASNSQSQGYSDNYIKVYIANANIPPNSLIKVKADRLYQDGLLAKLRPLQNLNLVIARSVATKQSPLEIASPLRGSQ